METTRSFRSARASFILVCGTFLGAGMILSGMGPSLPYLAERISRDVAALGGLFSALSLGVILVQAVIGRLSTRFGLRPMLTWGMIILAGGALALSIGPTLTALLAGAFVAGIGFGVVLAAGNTLVAQLFVERSASALNGVNVFFGVGSLLGPAIAGIGIQMMGTPQTTLWFGAALLMILSGGVLAFAAAPPPLPATATAEPSGVRDLQLWLLGLLLLLYAGTEIGLGGWIAVFMTASTGLEPTTAALATSGFWLALTLGRTFGALLGIRLKPLTLLISSLGGVLLGAGLLTLGVGNLPLTLSAILILGLACGPVFPTILALATAGRTGTGIVLGVGNGGGLILPAFLGIMLTSYGPTAMAATVLTSAVLMVGLWSVIARRSGASERVEGVRRMQA
jgi:MFS transporter, FHS family, L-fucose permease